MNTLPTRASSWRRTAQILLVVLFFVIPFSIAAVEILFFLLLASWLLGWIASKEKPPSIWRSSTGEAILFSLLLYLAVCAWTIPFSSYPKLSLLGLVKKMFQFSLFCVIVADVAQDPPIARNLRRAMLFSAAFVALYCMLQELAVILFIGKQGVALDPIRRIPLFYDRMVGPYSNPNDLATFLMVVVLAVAPLLLNRPIRSSIGLWTFSIVLMVCIAWTESKGAMLGMGIGLMLLFLGSTRNKGIGLKLAVIFFLTVGFFAVKGGDLLRNLTFSDTASHERSVMWHTAWRMIQMRPILGHGLNTFMANYLTYAVGPTQGPAYAHNCFLQIAAETGLFGLAAFLWFFWKLFSSGWRALKTASGQASAYKPLLAGVMAGLIAFLVQSAFDTNLYSLRQAVLFWSFSGLAVGLSASAAQRQES